MDLLNYNEAAKFLGVPTGSLYGLVSKKKIPHLRLARRTVRFERAALERWLSECAVDAVSASSRNAKGGAR